MMSSPPAEASALDRSINRTMFTKEGLPLVASGFTTAAAADAEESGPARRVDCRPPQLVVAPTTLRPSPSKSNRVSSDARRAKSFSEAPLRRSLIDDDDDEVIDYFGSCADAPVADEPTAVPDVINRSSTSQWNVREYDVPTLPSFYPIEKSAVFVPQASAPILAARIAAVLQARSVAASFDAKNAKVDCVSMQHVEFRIRLYRGRGEYSHGLIVEVQRLTGFDLSYSHDVYAILDAAEGKANQDLVEGLIAPIYFEEIEDGCSCSDEEDMDSVENTAGLTSLSVISDILCSQDKVTVEGRDFALYSLASLTSLDRMGQRAVPISKELLTSDVHEDLRVAVFSHIGPAPSQDQVYSPQRHMLQSLDVLANVATCSQSPAQLVELLSQDDRAILTNLITNIENAQLNPRAADLSCVVLKSCCDSSQGDLKDVLLPSHLKGRLVSALTKALSFGGVCHAKLERHSQLCLEMIQI